MPFADNILNNRIWFGNYVKFAEGLFLLNVCSSTLSHPNKTFLYFTWLTPVARLSKRLIKSSEAGCTKHGQLIQRISLENFNFICWIASNLLNSAIWRIKFKLRCSMHGWHCYIFKTYPPDKPIQASYNQIVTWKIQVNIMIWSVCKKSNTSRQVEKVISKTNSGKQYLINKDSIKYVDPQSIFCSSVLAEVKACNYHTTVTTYLLTTDCGVK